MTLKSVVFCVPERLGPALGSVAFKPPAFDPCVHRAEQVIQCLPPKVAAIRRVMVIVVRCLDRVGQPNLVCKGVLETISAVSCRVEA